MGRQLSGARLRRSFHASTVDLHGDGPTELFGRRGGWNNFDRTVQSGSFSWSIFKLTEPFGHELLIAVSSKRSPGFSCGLREMAASYDGLVRPRRDGWSFRRDEWLRCWARPRRKRDERWRAGRWRDASMRIHEILGHTGPRHRACSRGIGFGASDFAGPVQTVTGSGRRSDSLRSTRQNRTSVR